MAFSFGLNPLLLVLCVLLAGGLTYWTYKQTIPPLPSGKRVLLGGIRFVVLFIVLFLLFDPIVRRLTREEHPPVVAFLIDSSQSIRVTGSERDTTSATVPQDIHALLQQLSPGTIPGESRIYSFSSGVKAHGAAISDWLDSLKFNGSRTDIARALDYVREDLKDQNLRGVVLISDGQYNTGRNPLYIAERYPVPIYTAVVGDTTQRKDVQIRRLTTNQIAYAGEEQPVQVGLRVEDFESEEVTVSLEGNGQLLGSKRIRLPDGAAEVLVDLSYIPTQQGLQPLTASVSRLPGEATFRNNTETVNVRVLQRKRRTLLIGAGPGPDFAAVRQILQKDADTEVATFVQKDNAGFYEGAFPTRLDTFDTIIMVGFPGRSANPAAVERVVRAAREDMPLLFLLTRQTDLNALARNFGEVLPAIPETIRRSFVEAQFAPTSEGRRHPVLSIPEASSPETWLRLPPLAYNESKWRVTPDARILAATTVRGVPVNDPLLIVRARSGGRSAMLLGAGTWRWKNVPEGLDALANFWPTLLSNAVQWVATRQDDRPVRVHPVLDVFAGGETVQFTGEVYDESLNPVSNASVSLEIMAPDSTRYPYQMQPVGSGRYSLDAGAFPEGSYSYTATAIQEGANLGADSGTFLIGSVTLEFKETRANASLMQQIARRSGGGFWSGADIGALPTALSSSGDLLPTVTEEQQELGLAHLYVFLVILIVLLSTEWFLRKRSGMV